MLPVRMRRTLQCFLLCLILCQHPLAQTSPAAVSVARLSQDPRAFDGRLVIVRGVLVLGWEGDNFLYDAPAIRQSKSPSHGTPKLWLYCRPGSEQSVFGNVPYSFRPMAVTVVGYFHFVPDKKGRTKDVFDPGPLHLEGVAATGVDGPAGKR